MLDVTLKYLKNNDFLGYYFVFKVQNAVFRNILCFPFWTQFLWFFCISRIVENLPHTYVWNEDRYHVSETLLQKLMVKSLQLLADYMPHVLSCPYTLSLTRLVTVPSKIMRRWMNANKILALELMKKCPLGSKKISCQNWKFCDWMFMTHFVINLLDIFVHYITGMVPYLALHFNPIPVITSLKCVLVMKIEMGTT